MDCIVNQWVPAKLIHLFVIQMPTVYLFKAHLFANADMVSLEMDTLVTLLQFMKEMIWLSALVMLCKNSI